MDKRDTHMGTPARPEQASSTESAQSYVDYIMFILIY